MDTLKNLHGDRWVVVTSALAQYRVGLASRAKADATAGLDTEQHDHFDEIAEAFLTALGWQPPEKQKKEKAAKADPKQMDFTKDQAPESTTEARGTRTRVKCVQCTKLFAMATGMEQLAACPDCGAVHEVNSSDDGTLFKIRERPQMPTHIFELFVQSKDTKLWKRAAKVRRVTLDNWLSEHPTWIESPELVTRGDRVADPEVPGTGNPLRIDCHDKSGNECGGFDSFDTPGTTLCDTCGQKYKIEIVEGQVVVSLWSLDDHIAEQESAQENPGPLGEPADRTEVTSDVE